MQDVMMLTEVELHKELNAFYDFVRVVGMGYLNDEGTIRFNQLRAEYIRRVEEEEKRLEMHISPELLRHRVLKREESSE